MIADGELDAIIVAGARHELERTSTNLEEVLRVHPRLPISQMEFDHFREVVTLWQRQGRGVRPLPPGISPEGASDEELRSEVTGSARKGLLFLSATDLDVGLLIVKVDAGNGLFGRQRTLFACFMVSNHGRLRAVGTVKTLTLAKAKLGACYRL